MSTLRLDSLEFEENDQQRKGSFDSSNSLHTDWSLSSDGVSLLHKSTGVHITHEGTKGLESDYGLGDVYVSLGDFEVNPTPLGHGRSSVVFSAIHKLSGKTVAIKDIYVGDILHQTQLSAEIHSWRLTSYCPLLVQFLGAFIKPNKNVVCLVMEYMEFGTLSDILYKNLNRDLKNDEVPKGVSERFLKFIAIQMVDGLVYLHQNNRIHRDVKLNNILINQDGAVKISDFGISKLIDQNNAKDHNKNVSTFVGTQIYMSPERLQGKSYSFSSDIWSLGICLYELAVGTHPFKNLSLFDMVYILCEDNSENGETLPFLEKIIKRCPLPESLHKNTEFYAFLRGCLELDPLKRLTATQLQGLNWLNSGTCNRFEFLNWLQSIQKQDNTCENAEP
ncbi:protein kinase NPK2 [Cryptosporidium canis]|nr:protein kinase NPK2 [Cryptosporidium canis]